MASSEIIFSQKNINVFLLPGQGSDHRLYEKFKFPEHVHVEYVTLPVPEKGAGMKDYAIKISKQIDTSGYTVLIGTSLGGMVSTELTKLYNIEKTIIISSAKCRGELPFRYRFQKYVPIYKIVPKKLIKWGALIVQPLVEPDRKNNKETFVRMLKSKDPTYLKRTIDIIVKWDARENPENIIHIHGNKDHTIPVRNVNYDFLVEGGSHMMALTRGEEIFKIVKKIVLG